MFFPYQQWDNMTKKTADAVVKFYTEKGGLF